jgi:hypothetical protein
MDIDFGSVYAKSGYNFVSIWELLLRENIESLVLDKKLNVECVTKRYCEI